ncbi:MAG TPA: SDR family NAD(P)-dependent oxidoreductase, partial [Blastocatellia bacterium]|nr:SDR family NAD(P)-dependent oxidoreductase [Blastocatellia bacterium]
MSLSDLMKSYDFTGRTIVITGGTGVLCGAMAKSLVGCGANVAILARSVEKGEALLTEIRKDISGPGRALIVAGDVLDQETLQQATRRVLDEFGRIDGLINGAGGNSPQATTRPDLTFFNLPEDALRYVFDLNMLGTILPCQVFGRQMAEQGEGVILNVSSMSAVRPLTRVIGYSAAKAGINNFTQWLAVHLAQQYSPRLRV